eukprot:COSAG01_NODE_316_length_19004_cov_100.001322_8_plen_83_part_00
MSITQHFINLKHTQKVVPDIITSVPDIITSVDISRSTVLFGSRQLIICDAEGLQPLQRLRPQRGGELIEITASPPPANANEL